MPPEDVRLTIYSPDTDDAFENNPYYASQAFGAPIPFGYTQAFVDLNASNSQAGYMGFTTLNSYDTMSCAAKCNAIDGCTAINIYFERDPSLDPNAAACPNPPSVTNIKVSILFGPNQ